MLDPGSRYCIEIKNAWKTLFGGRRIPVTRYYRPLQKRPDCTKIASLSEIWTAAQTYQYRWSRRRIKIPNSMSIYASSEQGLVKFPPTWASKFQRWLLRRRRAERSAHRRLVRWSLSKIKKKYKKLLDQAYLHWDSYHSFWEGTMRQWFSDHAA